MKANLGITAFILLGIAVSATAAAGGGLEGKIAVLDMEQVMGAHPETRLAEQLLQSQADEYEAEKDAMLAKFERLKEEFEAARDALDNKALSDGGRARKRQEAESKFNLLRDYDRELRQTTLLRQKQLMDRKRRMRERIINKIREVVKSYATEKGFLLVLDSGVSLDDPGAVLYAAQALDITDDILKIVAAQKANRDELKEIMQAREIGETQKAKRAEDLSEPKQSEYLIKERSESEESSGPDSPLGK